MYSNVTRATQLWIGLSGDKKPTVEGEVSQRVGAIEEGARLIELDTGLEFRYYGGAAHGEGGRWYGPLRTDPLLIAALERQRVLLDSILSSLTDVLVLNTV